jgi:sporulation protein YlmC with PRC-barrel domain
MAEKELYYLSELSDYKVASDQPDIRGWKIKDADGRTVGRVEDFVVHKNSERVVYVDVEVDPELIDIGRDPFQGQKQEGVSEYIDRQGDNHVIVPVGMVDIDKDQKLVRTDAIDHTTFRNTRRYRKGSDIDRDYEVSVYNNYVPAERRLPESARNELYEREEFRRKR